MIVASVRGDLSWLTDDEWADDTNRLARIPADNLTLLRKLSQYQKSSTAKVLNKAPPYNACAISKEVGSIMSNPTDIGSQFLTTFYQTFDTNRAGLAPLYVSVQS